MWVREDGFMSRESEILGDKSPSLSLPLPLDLSPDELIIQAAGGFSTFHKLPLMRNDLWGSYSPSGLGLPRAEWAVGNVAINKHIGNGSAWSSMLLT